MDNIDNLAAEAADLDREATAATLPPGSPGAPGAEPLPPPDSGRDIAGLLEMFRELARPVFPSVAALYTDEAIARVAGPVGALCDKHGWNVGDLFGKWKEEILAAVVVVPLAIATVKAMRDDLEAKAAAQAKPVEAAPADEPKPA